MADRSRAPHRPARKVDLRAMAAIRRLQANPELGEFRIHAALAQRGIHLSPSTCGRILALHRALGAPRPAATVPHEPQPMPFAAQYRHQVWSTDVRYLDHQLGDFKVYSITILDNYSRAVLASDLSRSQDQGAFLRVLRQAIARYGAPMLLVSDSGKVFLAKHAQRVYAALRINKAGTRRGQSWQNYVETLFTVQRRMADWNFGRATTWEELVASHDQWVSDYNTQVHFAHQRREDGRHSPVAVLDWVRGRPVDAEELAAAFAPVHEPRRVDRSGYIRFRHWRLYGERGLAQQTVGVWLTEERLVIVSSDEPLAHYTVRYARDRHQLQAVREERLFVTPFQSPQPPLWEPAEGEWLRVLRLPPPRPRRPRPRAVGEQRVLFTAEE